MRSRARQRGIAARVRALVAAALIACAIVAAAGADAAGRHADLRVVRSAPLTVHGSGFRAAERVRLTVRTTTRSLARSLVAGPRGTFDARFAGVALGHCGAFSIVARGTAGSRAAVAGHRGLASCNPG